MKRFILLSILAFAGCKEPAREPVLYRNDAQEVRKLADDLLLKTIHETHQRSVMFCIEVDPILDRIKTDELREHYRGVSARTRNTLEGYLDWCSKLPPEYRDAYAEERCQGLLNRIIVIYGGEE